MPLQRIPAPGSGMVAWAYRARTACAFRFSQPRGAFFRPSACRPYFMPDPLMGFALQSISPHAQVNAVSDAITLLSFKRLFAPTRPPTPSASAQHDRPYGKVRKAAPAFRALLHARVRHFCAQPLGLTRARSSLGLPSSRVFPLAGVAGPSPCLPS